jgi:hypothetical protein
MLVLRGVMVGLTTVLGVVLLARGDVVVGALLLALAAARLVSIGAMARRRHERQQRRSQLRARVAERRRSPYDTRGPRGPWSDVA